MVLKTLQLPISWGCLPQVLVIFLEALLINSDASSSEGKIHFTFYTIACEFLQSKGAEFSVLFSIFTF